MPCWNLACRWMSSILTDGGTGGGVDAPLTVRRIVVYQQRLSTLCNEWWRVEGERLRLLR